MIWIILLVLLVLLKIKFSPRIEITSQKDVLLFYKTGRFTRDYIFLFSL